MTDEEKEAIENLRKILFTTMQANKCGLSNNDFKTEIKTYTDILVLIEKQESKINALQMEHNYDVKMIDEVKGETVRLYKMIDEMAKYIASLDIEEDICERTGKDLYQCDCMAYGECEHCIKEYFKKKVEDK